MLASYWVLIVILLLLYIIDLTKTAEIEKFCLLWDQFLNTGMSN